MLSDLSKEQVGTLIWVLDGKERVVRCAFKHYYVMDSLRNRGLITPSRRGNGGMRLTKRGQKALSTVPQQPYMKP